VTALEPLHGALRSENPLDWPPDLSPVNSGDGNRRVGKVLDELEESNRPNSCSWKRMSLLFEGAFDLPPRGLAKENFTRILPKIL